MSKHTEGPWKLRPYTKAGETEYLIDTGDGWTTAKVYATIPGEDEANARIMTAAPDLLAACRATLAHMYDDEIDAPTAAQLTEQLTRAIAKAEGGQQ